MRGDAGCESCWGTGYVRGFGAPCPEKGLSTEFVKNLCDKAVRNVVEEFWTRFWKDREWIQRLQ